MICHCYLDHLNPEFIERGSHSSLEIGERETKRESVRGGGNQDRRQMEGCLLTPPPPSVHLDKKVRVAPPPLLPPPPPHVVLSLSSLQNPQQWISVMAFVLEVVREYIN